MLNTLRTAKTLNTRLVVAFWVFLFWLSWPGQSNNQLVPFLFLLTTTKCWEPSGASWQRRGLGHPFWNVRAAEGAGLWPQLCQVMINMFTFNFRRRWWVLSNPGCQSLTRRLPAKCLLTRWSTSWRISLRTLHASLIVRSMKTEKIDEEWFVFKCVSQLCFLAQGHFDCETLSLVTWKQPKEQEHTLWSTRI